MCVRDVRHKFPFIQMLYFNFRKMIAKKKKKDCFRSFKCLEKIKQISHNIISHIWKEFNFFLLLLQTFQPSHSFRVWRCFFKSLVASWEWIFVKWKNEIENERKNLWFFIIIWHLMYYYRYPKNISPVRYSYHQIK
jgi:hypothetical protein